MNHPPDPPLIETTRRADQGRILVGYFLRDDDGGPLDVTVEWQPEDGSAGYEAATEFQGPLDDGQGNRVQSQGREGLLTEPNKGRPAVFVWDARLDLERALGKPVAWVRLRLAAREEARPGEAGFSDPFIAGNEPPEVLSIEPEAASGVIPVAVTVADSTADLVRFKATYRLGEVAKCMTLASEEGDFQGESGAFSADGNQTLTTVSGPVSLAIGDLNGDGRNDLAVANSEKNAAGEYTLSLFLAR